MEHNFLFSEGIVCTNCSLCFTPTKCTGQCVYIDLLSLTLLNSTCVTGFIFKDNNVNSALVLTNEDFTNEANELENCSILAKPCLVQMERLNFQRSNYVCDFVFQVYSFLLPFLSFRK